MAKARKPLRRKSAKRIALEKETNPARHKFVEDVGTCMICRQRPAQDPHEIPRGPAREKALREPRSWLAVCRICHDELDDFVQWPIARQIAVRMYWEIEQTCFIINELRCRAQTDCTPSDVLEWLANGQ